MRHVLSLFDLSADEIRRVLEISSDLKSKLKAGERPPLFQQKVMGLLFEKPSLRTRVSFETGMVQLGGGALFLGAEAGWGKREPIGKQWVARDRPDSASQPAIKLGPCRGVECGSGD